MVTVWRPPRVHRNCYVQLTVHSSTIMPSSLILSSWMIGLFVLLILPPGTTFHFTSMNHFFSNQWPGASTHSTSSFNTSAGLYSGEYDKDRIYDRHKIVDHPLETYLSQLLHRNDSNSSISCHPSPFLPNESIHLSNNPQITTIIPQNIDKIHSNDRKSSKNGSVSVLAQGWSIIDYFPFQAFK